MSLPDVSRLGTITAKSVAERLCTLGLNREWIRRMTGGRGDDLRTPLVATREAQLVDTAANLALRLFFCGHTETAAKAAEALGDDCLCMACDGGLLLHSAGYVHAPFHLRIVRGLYLFSDYLGGRTDEVMGAGETTEILYHAGRPSQPIARALDLGCGAGTLALLLAADADIVVGTDINPRAITLARFNSAFNGITNTDFRTGDVFAPVQGETFDLILSQPPYYPASAEPSQTFLHGGVRGDEIAMQIARGLRPHLTNTGRAILFASWPKERQDFSSDLLDIVELTTNRREPHGTRQSIDIFQHAGGTNGWMMGIEVPADCWGDVQPWRIDQMFATETLLRADEERLLDTKLCLPEGTTAFDEDGGKVLRCSCESLIGTTYVPDSVWSVLSPVAAAPNVRAILPLLQENPVRIVRDLLRRGLLVPVETGIPSG